MSFFAGVDIEYLINTYLDAVPIRSSVSIEAAQRDAAILLVAVVAMHPLVTWRWCSSYDDDEHLSDGSRFLQDGKETSTSSTQDYTRARVSPTPRRRDGEGAKG